MHQREIKMFACTVVKFVVSYLFGTNTAKHTFCRHCGIHSFYVPRSNPDGFSVNIRCLDDIDIAAVRPRPFNGRHWEEKMRARREAGAT